MNHCELDAADFTGSSKTINKHECSGVPDRPTFAAKHSSAAVTLETFLVWWAEVIWKDSGISWLLGGVEYSPSLPNWNQYVEERGWGRMLSSSGQTSMEKTCGRGLGQRWLGSGEIIQNYLVMKWSDEATSVRMRRGEAGVGFRGASLSLLIPVNAGLFIGNSEGLLIHFHVRQ